MVQSGGRRGGSGPETGAAGPVQIRSGTSRGALPKVLWDLLSLQLERLRMDPAHERVVIRDLMKQLERAYPQLRVNDSDLAQECAEEDGEAIDEGT